jgi:RNA polymerase sigma factor (sigma-70 family)
MSRDYSSPIPAPFDATDAPLDGAAAVRDEVSALFATYSPTLTRYLRSQYSNEHAEELTQEAFLRLYNLRVSGGRIGNPEAWLIAVSRRIAISRWRKKTRDAQGLRDLATVLDELSQTASPEAIWLNHERIAAIRHAEHRLTDLERACLSMRARGLTFEEIGKRITMDFRRVADIVARAIRQLNAAQE